MPTPAVLSSDYEMEIGERRNQFPQGGQEDVLPFLRARRPTFTSTREPA